MWKKLEEVGSRWILIGFGGYRLHARCNDRSHFSATAWRAAHLISCNFHPLVAMLVPIDSSRTRPVAASRIRCLFQRDTSTEHPGDSDPQSFLTRRFNTVFAGRTRRGASSQPHLSRPSRSRRMSYNRFLSVSDIHGCVGDSASVQQRATHSSPLTKIRRT
jgi:hypothetical protein